MQTAQFTLDFNINSMRSQALSALPRKVDIYNAMQRTACWQSKNVTAASVRTCMYLLLPCLDAPAASSGAAETPFAADLNH